MTVDRFTAARRPRWQELEDLLRTARRGSLRHATAADLERFGVLYRHAAGDLAIARRDFPDDPVTGYLNGLCSRAHPLLYRGDPPRLAALPGFFATGLPRAVRQAWPYVAMAVALLLAGAVAGWLAVVLRPDLAPSLVPSSIFDKMARGQLGGGIPDAPFVASFIIQNNVRVALLCFAGGVLLGLPTAAILLTNGWTIGTLAAAVHGGGFDLQFWALIVPHGVLELSVIVLSGATGLMLGDSLLRPGLLRRGDALAATARRAVGIVCGVACLLVLAGCLEAFVSPSGLPDAVKLAVGAGVGAALYSWLVLAGRERARRPAWSLDRDAAAGAGAAGREREPETVEAAVVA